MRKVMSEQMMLYLMIGAGVLLVALLVLYVVLNNKMKSKETKYIAQLTEGTKTSNFSMEIIYQKIYIYCAKVPFLRRYVL